MLSAFYTDASQWAIIFQPVVAAKWELCAKVLQSLNNMDFTFLWHIRMPQCLTNNSDTHARVSRCLKSPVIRLFVQQFAQINIKEIIRAPLYWPFYEVERAHQWPTGFPHKSSVMRKAPLCHDVILTNTLWPDGRIRLFTLYTTPLSSSCRRIWRYWTSKIKPILPVILYAIYGGVGVLSGESYIVSINKMGRSLLIV